ncbi:MAG TPA: hypothetical protein DFR83_07800, partial [Deltaproteobacteria bacterium]|nr:hypothetical protein [Deltaproteobacteria bacterium]
MSSSTTSDHYSAFLTRQGFAITRTEYGDITIEREGRSYLLVIDEEDPELFRLVFPNFWKIESDTERARALHAAHAATAETKVAKVLVVGDNVWAGVEQFIPDLSIAEAVFERAMVSIMSGAERFVSLMRSD